MDMFILHSKWFGCWWPGDARSQGISSNDVDLVLSEYSGYNVTRADTSRHEPKADTLHNCIQTHLINENKFILAEHLQNIFPKGPIHNWVSIIT